MPTTCRICRESRGILDFSPHHGSVISSVWQPSLVSSISCNSHLTSVTFIPHRMPINDLSSCPHMCGLSRLMQCIELGWIYEMVSLKAFLGGVIRQYPIGPAVQPRFQHSRCPIPTPPFPLYPTPRTHAYIENCLDAWSRQTVRLSNREQARHSLIETGVHPTQPSHTEEWVGGRPLKGPQFKVVE